MVQTLHIFRKDIRRFRYELCVVAALTGAFAWCEAASDMPGQQELSRAVLLSVLSAFLLVCGWWFLLAQLIHEEALAGDRQFWVTRPYRWRHLLAAKLLFVVAFVNLPWLAAQMLILAATGYRPLAGVPQLLWMQFGLAAFLLAPAFALTTVTRNLAQFVLAILCGLIVWYMARFTVLPFIDNRDRWTSQAAVIPVAYAGAALVVGWQFSRRSTKVSICAGLAVVLLAGALYYWLPLTVRNAMRSAVLRGPEPRAVSVSIPPFATLTYNWNPRFDGLVIGLPFTITGLPAQEVARPEMLNVMIEAPAGLRWSSGWNSAFPVLGMPALETPYSRSIFLPRSFYRSVQGATVDIHGSMLLSLRLQAIVRLPPGQVTRIPGDGCCEISQDGNQWAIFCSSPFRRPFEYPGGWQGIAGTTAPIDYLGSLWEAPFPELSLSPVFAERSGSAGVEGVSLVREYPRVWIRREFAARVRMPTEY
jgi:hypothetical protein